ncbi:hypothetical protein [Streptomyces sp. NPDC101115]|uniref:hypothetical protein n=1 Tax=Streptomyces sp. NPDC101115 TaxID=3366106 RepID=UPI0038170E5A
MTTYTALLTPPTSVLADPDTPEQRVSRLTRAERLTALVDLITAATAGDPVHPNAHVLVAAVENDRNTGSFMPPRWRTGMPVPTSARGSELHKHVIAGGGVATVPADDVHAYGGDLAALGLGSVPHVDALTDGAPRVVLYARELAIGDVLDELTAGTVDGPRYRAAEWALGIRRPAPAWDALSPADTLNTVLSLARELAAGAARPDTARHLAAGAQSLAEHLFRSAPALAEATAVLPDPDTAPISAHAAQLVRRVRQAHGWLPATGRDIAASLDGYHPGSIGLGILPAAPADNDPALVFPAAGRVGILLAAAATNDTATTQLLADGIHDDLAERHSEPAR